eukprot:c28506_g1_i4 orf=436-2475(+)
MWRAWETARTQLRTLQNVGKPHCGSFILRGFWTGLVYPRVQTSSGDIVSVLRGYRKREVECSSGQMVWSLERLMHSRFERGFASQEGAERRDEDKREMSSDESYSDDNLFEDSDDETLEAKGLGTQKAKGTLSSDEDVSSDGEGHQTRLQKVRPVKPLSTKASTGEEEEPEEDIDSEEFDEDLENPLDMAADKVVGSMSQPVSGVPPLWIRISRAARKDKKSLCIKEIIEKWIGEGNTVSKEVIVYILTALRRNKFYEAALQVSDWVMKTKPFEINDLDYAFRVELVSRAHGIRQAENYFATIPKEFQTQMTYNNLLSVYVNCLMETKAENLVEKAEKLGVGVSAFMYNQLLLLYRRKGKTKKIVRVVRTMDEAQVEADAFTYNILLSLKLKKGDMKGMDMIAKKMKDDEVKPDATTYATLAKGYLAAGLTEKAEAAMAQVENADFSRNRVDYRALLQLNAQMGKADELERIWGKLLSSTPTVFLNDYLYMIEALGRVGKVERAEAMFKEMWKSKGIGRIRQYNALLSAYADQGMVVRAEELLKQMIEEPVSPNFMTYDHLIKMYVRLDLEHKVTETMEKIRKSMRSNGRNSVRDRPHYVTIQSAIDIFSKKGDVPNAERAFKDLKTAGYVRTSTAYCTLLDAYAKAGTAPYGFLDRMHADGAFPNEHVRTVLDKLHGT